MALADCATQGHETITTGSSKAAGMRPIRSSGCQAQFSSKAFCRHAVVWFIKRWCHSAGWPPAPCPSRPRGKCLA